MSDSTATMIDIILAIILPPLGVFIKYGCEVRTTSPHGRRYDARSLQIPSTHVRIQTLEIVDPI
jgi:hypothetical protein